MSVVLISKKYKINWQPAVHCWPMTRIFNCAQFWRGTKVASTNYYPTVCSFEAAAKNVSNLILLTLVNSVYICVWQTPNVQYCTHNTRTGHKLLCMIKTRKPGRQRQTKEQIYAIGD